MMAVAAAAVVGGVARARDLNCPWYSPPLVLLMLSDMSLFYVLFVMRRWRQRENETAALSSAYCALRLMITSLSVAWLLKFPLM
mmetsp:Transcript_25948/g.44043  ORF Transcript_25948/g.44043 Transcript_25948/m.44043 type:complete len:84 (-) Transcript_25948:35-286(-)